MIESHNFGSPAMRLRIALAFLLLLSTGCSDDDSPKENVAAPTLESLWPNDDGSFWAFEGENRWNHSAEWTEHATKAEVPPLGLTAAQLHKAMLAGELGPADGSGTGSWGFALDGTIVDGASQSCQQLTQTWRETLFLFDRVDGWLKTDERITLHRSDAPTGTIRVLLEKPLVATHQFEWLPGLDPSFYDQCFAAARSLGSFEAGGQTFESCIAVLYLMTSLQKSFGTNPNNPEPGWFRSSRISVIVLAPEIGPVYLREIQTTGDFVDGKAVGPFQDSELWLIDHGLLD
jgi:hypothetical protein